MLASDAPPRVAWRRVEWLILLLGAIAAGGIWIRWDWRTALGSAAGVFLSWINFRWLKQGVAGLVQSSLTGGTVAASKIARRAMLKFFGRFVLLAGVLYVILSRSWLPVNAVIAGLFAAAGAVLIEMIYLLARGLKSRPS
jgi:hypothetical protein